jgi:hypothetical protein
MPSFLEYMGYCFFFNNVWVGPAFEYRHYEKFVNREEEYKVIPERKKYVLITLGIGIGMTVFEQLFSGKYNFLHCTSDDFLYKYSFFQRF